MFLGEMQITHVNLLKDCASKQQWLFQNALTHLELQVEGLRTELCVCCAALCNARHQVIDLVQAEEHL